MQVCTTVLASAGIEVIFLPVALLCFGFSTKRMLVTLRFSVVAMKSRTFFFQFSYSVNKQVCTKGETIARQLTKAGQWKYSMS